MESSSDVMSEVHGALSVSPMLGVVMRSAGRHSSGVPFAYPPTSVPDEGEIDIPSNEEKDVLNILKKKF